MVVGPAGVEPGKLRLVSGSETRVVVDPRSEEAGSASAAPSPGWLRSREVTRLWSGQTPDATAFTDVPAGSYLQAQGPAQGSRIPVYYVGDGLFRKAGSAWVDASAVEAIEAPPPGSVRQVDGYAGRQMPEWVQAHRATALWSGPDERAIRLTDLPQWTYLRVDGLERGGRLLVWYTGDYGQRQPGIGWVDGDAVGPAGEPGLWVENHRAAALWSGPDERAQRFTVVPQWTALRVVTSAPPAPDRLMVEAFGDGSGRQRGIAWVSRADVGPITPPTPLPSNPGARPAQGEAAAAQPSESRVFESEDVFIQAVGDAARRSQANTRVPASVTVAQAILESDWGRSRLTRQANNLFGIKALSGPGPAGTATFSTWEHLSGKDVVVQAPFKAYNSLDESVDDHGWFFVRNSRYADALEVAGDPAAFAAAIQQDGYATDPAYAAKLVRLMDRYDLYRFDE